MWPFEPKLPSAVVTVWSRRLLLCQLTVSPISAATRGGPNAACWIETKSVAAEAPAGSATAAPQNGRRRDEHAQPHRLTR